MFSFLIPWFFKSLFEFIDITKLSVVGLVWVVYYGCFFIISFSVGKLVWVFLLWLLLYYFICI